MITSLFRKSTPLNYSLVIIGLVFTFFLYFLRHVTPKESDSNLLIRLVSLGLVFGFVFLANFVVKKNGISKDSAYTVLFFWLFLMAFPSVLSQPLLLISNFFILLATRRIVSLHSLKDPKEKIFDASLWVFIASLFHFWSILFIVLIFISILFHVARDYRNWFLPPIAFLSVAVVFVFISLFFNTGWIQMLLAQSIYDFKIDYFTKAHQNITLSIYATIALFFVASLLFSLSNRPLILHPTYKKVISAFFIGLAVYFISPNKSNDLLVFSFAPLAMIATAHIEMPQVQWKKEVVLALLILFSFVAFFSQL